MGESTMTAFPNNKAVLYAVSLSNTTTANCLMSFGLLDGSLFDSNIKKKKHQKKRTNLEQFFLHFRKN